MIANARKSECIPICNYEVLQPRWAHLCVLGTNNGFRLIVLTTTICYDIHDPRIFENISSKNKNLQLIHNFWDVLDIWLS